jgi:hypothetical protein
VGATTHETRAAFLPREVAATAFAAALLLALVNGVAIAVAVPLPAAGLSLRIPHLVFDAAETLGIGAAGALLAATFVRFVRLPRWAFQALFFALAVLLVYGVVGAYLELQAAHGKGSKVAPLVFLNYLLLFGGAVAAAPALPSMLARWPRLRYAPVAIAVSVLVADQVPLRDDYFAIHGLIALGGLVVPPPDTVRCELFRQPCAVAPWALAATVWRAPSLHAPVSLPPSPWAKDRSKDPPIPFTSPPLMPRDAVVVLITIDALRADVVNPPTNDERFPTFAALKRDGVVFTHASSAGTQTPLSLSTMLSGLYFSQQRWEDYGTAGDRYPYPAKDTFPRVPELLSAHGVATVQEAGFVFLADDFGVMRGFREEHQFGATKSAAPAHILIGAMLERLEHADDGPLFLYTHLAEPHAPYRFGPKGTDYEHYLSAIDEADAQVGRVLAYLERHFADRWVLLVSADHGEAFGDHQTFEHAKSLYEELVHVPLLARSPRFKARTVDERVGLVDLGPTLLDLFQVPTPATFNGQSLVPILAGGTVTFTRPLLAEGRLRQAFTQQDGFKVIEDPRRKTVEAYDLAADPGETRNVFDLEPQRADRALATLREFFKARTRHDGGYQPPYKP